MSRQSPFDFVFAVDPDFAGIALSSQIDDADDDAVRLFKQPLQKVIADIRAESNVSKLIVCGT